jgi:hemerythrin-like domain-containing protein
MNLLDLPAGFDDPVESLLGFHRRIERQLASLGRLPVRLETFGVDAESSAVAASLVVFFERALPLHHADEERELLPLLDQRIFDAGERRDFRELQQRLEGDHREIERTWRRLRRPLEVLGEGVYRPLDLDVVQYFRALHAMHISAEEAALHMVALRLLPEDRALLSRRMAARRRGLSPPFPQGAGRARAVT